MFLDWLFGKKTLKQPMWTQTSPTEDFLLQQLNSELLQTLGVYRPGQAPVIYSPVQTRNRWSRATLAHEEMHQALTINTSYGIFYQFLARVAKQEARAEILSMCLRAQWGAQEGTATYVQMAFIAIDDPEGFDEAVSFLPTASLGQQPYREWFDQIERLLPLAPVGAQEDLLRTSDQADFVVALGSYAMSSDVFVSFPKPETLEVKSFEDYLAREGPDIRLAAMLQNLASGTALYRLFGEFRSICAAERAGEPLAERPVQWLIRSLASLSPGHPYVDIETCSKQAQELSQVWSPTAVLKVLDSSQADSSADAPLAELRYLPDWAERFPHAFADETLTAEIFRAQLSAAQQEGVGLACSIAMTLPGELHLTTMPYPRGTDINPSSWEEILKLLENPPTAMNVLATGEVLEVLEAFPGAQLWLDFIGPSWRAWDQVTAGRDLLRNRVQVCSEHELTERGLRQLLCFRDLARAAEYTVFRVHGEQYAVCLMDRSRPGLYALQGIAGDAGLEIFERLTKRLNLRQFPGKLSDLPHAGLIRLAGQGFLL